MDKICIFLHMKHRPKKRTVLKIMGKNQLFCVPQAVCVGVLPKKVIIFSCNKCWRMHLLTFNPNKVITKYHHNRPAGEEKEKYF